MLPSHITPAHNGALVMEAQPQCKGRPAATGRELMRLVRLCLLIEAHTARDSIQLFSYFLCQLICCLIRGSLSFELTKVNEHAREFFV